MASSCFQRVWPAPDLVAGSAAGPLDQVWQEAEMGQIAMLVMPQKACSVVLGGLRCMAGERAIPKLVGTVVVRRGKPEA